MSTRLCGPSARRSQLRVALFILLFLTSLSPIASLTPAARAQDHVEPSGYREAIRGALAEYESQNYLEALTLFTRAHQLYPNSRTLRGLGIVSFELRRYSDTVEYLQSALASDERPLDPERRAETERLLARAKTFVAELRLIVVPPSASLRVDGSEARDVPKAPLLLSAGSHQLEFLAPGYEPASRAYTVVGGEHLSWKIILSRIAAASEESARVEPAKRPRRWQKALGGTAIGLGVLAFVGSGVLAAQRNADGKRVRGTDVFMSTYPFLLADWKNSRFAPYALAATGALVATSGALGLVLAAPRESYPPWAEIATATVGVGLAAWGIVDVVAGGPCDLEPKYAGKCVRDQQQRDRGALVILAATPFLGVSVTQLVRRGFAPKADVSLTLVPQISSSETSVSLGARVRCL